MNSKLIIKFYDLFRAKYNVIATHEAIFQQFPLWDFLVAA